METLRGRDLVKVFEDGTRALDGVSFEARRGRVLGLLGPSGCGKTTLLRIVAGLEQPTSGTLELDGERFDRLECGRRGVGFVFQNYALYPHLTVAGNLSLSLEARRIAEVERRRRVGETAEMLGIGGLLDRRPGQLSGGEQQRVALGRALVRRPRFCLLDEPLSNLDAVLRESMRAELKGLFRRLDTAVIYVTHDQTEAMSLSDDLAVMRAGRILQRGSPLEVHRRPADLFVAGFVGSPRMNLWRGRRTGDALECRGVRLPIPHGLDVGDELVAGIRPEDVEISGSRIEGGWLARPTLTEALGSKALLTCSVGGEEVRALTEAQELPGEAWIRWPAERVHWFEASTGRRLAEAIPV